MIVLFRGVVIGYSVDNYSLFIVVDICNFQILIKLLWTMNQSETTNIRYN